MPIPDKIKQYEIDSELGSGAMGEVYYARDTRMFNRPVAIKILSERLLKTDIAHSRFRLEVEVAAKLAHPNIVTIFDQGELDGRPYFVMEYLQGFDVDHLIRNPQLRSFADKLRIAYQICEGLDYAHAQGVIHRDLKPANIMITERGGRDEAKLVDFGIVHVDESGLTQDGAQPGTFNYMAPEQLAPDGLNVVSPSLDLFSLGIVLFELFTGKHPFGGTMDVVTANRILTGDREPIGEHLPEEAKDLEKILTQLLEHDPAARPGRAAEVSLTLQSVLLPFQGNETDPTRDQSIPGLPEATIDRQVQRAVSDLELGRLDDARRLLVEALKRDATNPRAKLMLDRILLISEHRIPYRPYFRALRQARETFRAGDRNAAREWCQQASEIWEQDFEWRDLQHEIESGTLSVASDLPATQTSPGAKTALADGTTQLEMPTEPLPAPPTPPRPAAKKAPVRPRKPAPTQRVQQAPAATEFSSSAKPKPTAEPWSRSNRRPLIYAIAGVATVAFLGLALAWFFLPGRSATTRNPGRTPNPLTSSLATPEPEPETETAAEAEAAPVSEVPVEAKPVLEPEPFVAPPPVVEQRQEAPAQILPEPAPAEPAVASIAVLRISSSPSGASVVVDGEPLGSTPAVYQGRPGNVRVTLSLSGYDSLTREMDLTAGTATGISEVLVKRSGFLNVRTNPSTSAEVFVDNRYAGKTPLTELRLDEGAHQLRVEATGYEDFLGEVRIGNGQTQAFTASLTAVQIVEARPQEPEVIPTPTPTPTPTPRPFDLETLWSSALNQRDTGQFNSLEKTLDKILAIDPDYEQAPRWKRKTEDWIEDQEDELAEVLEEMMENFAAYVEDRELDNISELWNEKLDAGTREYFTRLFNDWDGPLRLKYDDVRVTTDDGSANFSIPVVVRAKREKGRSNEFEEVDNFEWQGRAEKLEDDDDMIFTLPFL